jgi:hypothetical protein
MKMRPVSSSSSKPLVARPAYRECPTSLEVGTVGTRCDGGAKTVGMPLGVLGDGKSLSLRCLCNDLQ